MTLSSNQEEEHFDIITFFASFPSRQQQQKWTGKRGETVRKREEKGQPRSIGKKKDTKNVYKEIDASPASLSLGK
jgi:hypothetical protein